MKLIHKIFFLALWMAEFLSVFGLQTVRKTKQCPRQDNSLHEFYTEMGQSCVTSLRWISRLGFRHWLSSGHLNWSSRANTYGSIDLVETWVYKGRWWNSFEFTLKWDLSQLEVKKCTCIHWKIHWVAILMHSLHKVKEAVKLVVLIFKITKLNSLWIVISREIRETCRILCWTRMIFHWLTLEYYSLLFTGSSLFLHLR